MSEYKFWNGWATVNIFFWAVIIFGSVAYYLATSHPTKIFYLFFFIPVWLIVCFSVDSLFGLTKYKEAAK